MGQTTLIDSLETIYKNAPNDSMRIRVLKDISWEYINGRNNPELAKKYIDSFLTISKKANIPWG